MTTSQPSFAVVRSDPARTTEAMSALLGAGPAAASRFAEQAVAASIRLDLVWCVQDQLGRYRLAVLAVPSVGRTAMLIASHARSLDDVANLTPAISAAAEGVADVADIAQALVDPSHLLDVAAFERGGLRRIAVLDYLERQLPRTGTLNLPVVPPQWTIEPLASRAQLDGSDPHALGGATRAELVALLDETYVGTRDCPGLAGMRRTSDVLDGHFGSGARRRHWLIARRDGKACGLCLLNGSPDGRSAELAYFGIAHFARGNGLGTLLLARGLHACSADRMSTVTLALDAENEPARALYDAAGFRKTISRVALVKPLAR